MSIASPIYPITALESCARSQLSRQYPKLEESVYDQIREMMDASPFRYLDILHGCFLLGGVAGGCGVVESFVRVTELTNPIELISRAIRLSLSLIACLFCSLFFSKPAFIRREIVFLLQDMAPRKTGLYTLDDLEDPGISLRLFPRFESSIKKTIPRRIEEIRKAYENLNFLQRYLVGDLIK